MERVPHNHLPSLEEIPQPIKQDKLPVFLDTLSAQTIHTVTDNHLPSLEDIGEHIEQDGLPVKQPIDSPEVLSLGFLDAKCEYTCTYSPLQWL